MYQTATVPQKAMGFLLALCMILIGVFAAPTAAQAAGEGYTDLYRVYTLTGVHKNSGIIAVVLAYGDPADGSYVVMKIKESTGTVGLDVLTKAQFDALVADSVTSTQIEVGNFNEMMLAQGVPDEFLLLEEKPYAVAELEKALAAKQTGATIVDNPYIMLEALNMAASKGGGDFRIRFDTKVNNGVNVRMYVNPSACTKGFATAAATYTEDNFYLDHFRKHYSNQFAMVEFLQEGSFGTTVEVAAKADLQGLDTGSLVFYHYDAFKNSVSRLEDPRYSIDESGYLHFFTSYGGAIMITDKPLASR